MNTCTKRGTWSKKGTTYRCSKTADAEGFAGKPVFSFCDEKLCAIGLAVELDVGDWKSWNDRFVEMKQTLVKQHGPPTVEKQTVSAECQSERFVQCMDDGSASVEATWQWNEGHRVSLTMSRKKSGDGPSAIRYTSVVNAGP